MTVGGVRSLSLSSAVADDYLSSVIANKWACIDVVVGTVVRGEISMMERNETKKTKRPTQ